MANSENMDEEQIDPKLDETIDEISEKIADSIVSKVIRWIIRTIIGLVLFGVLWHFYDWAFWLFWAYVILATLSLALQIYLHSKLVKLISNGAAEQGRGDNG